LSYLEPWQAIEAAVDWAAAFNSGALARHCAVLALLKAGNMSARRTEALATTLPRKTSPPPAMS
nr:hypothetical protein [Alphaproteobacteria bacterium]